MNIDKDKLKKIGEGITEIFLRTIIFFLICGVLGGIGQWIQWGYENQPVATLVNVESKDRTIDDLHKMKKDLIGYKARFSFEDNKVEMAVYQQGERPSTTETFIKDSDGNYVQYGDDWKYKLKFSKFIWYVKEIKMERCSKNDSIDTILTFKRD